MIPGPLSQLSFELKVIMIPIIKRSKVKDYTQVFSCLDGFGVIWIVIGEYRTSTALAEVLESIAGVVQHRLMDSILLGEKQVWERILSEDWKLRLRRQSEWVEIEIKRMSPGIPMDNELQATTVDLHQVRHALVGLVESSISLLEEDRPWLRSLPRRQNFVEELHRLAQLKIG